MSEGFNECLILIVGVGHLSSSLALQCAHLEWMCPTARNVEKLEDLHPN